MTTASYDIALDDEGLMIGVDWNRDGMWDHARSGMDLYWSTGDYKFGSSRRSTPQRPTIAAGTGRLVVAGDDFVPGRSQVLTSMQLQRRNPCRVRLDCDLDNPGTMIEPLFEGWIEAPRHQGSQGTGGVLSTFNLEGHLVQPGRERREFSQPSPATTSTAVAVLDLLRSGYGLDPSDFAADIDATPLSLYSFEGSPAEYASQFAQVSGGLPCARRSGGLRLQDPNNRPATIPVFSNSDYVITKATTEFDIEQLWNRAIINYQNPDIAGRAAGSAGQTRTFRVTRHADYPNPGSISYAGLPSDELTVTFPAGTLPALPEGVVYRDLEASLEPVSANIVYAYNGIHSTSVGSVQSVSGSVPWTVSLGSRQDDGSIVATVSGRRQPGTWTLSSPLFLRDRHLDPPRPDFSQSSFDGYLYGGNSASSDTGFFDGFGSYYIGIGTIVVNVVLTWRVDDTRTFELLAGNAESQQQWDPRTLTFPIWFAATAQASVQARIDELAEPRDIVTVDFALRQPTAVRTRDVARIQPGDHIGVYIDEPGEKLDINAAVMVMNVAYRLARNRLSTKRLICIEAGAIAVTKPPTLAAPTVVALSRSEIRATWTAPADDGAGALDGYRARWRRLNAGQWRIVDDIAGLTVDVAGLAPSTQYEVQVAAVRGGVSGDWSPSGTATTLAASRPARMAAPTVVQGPLNTQLDVSWVAPDDGGSEITHYDSRRRLSPSGAWVETRDISGNLRTSRVSRLEVDTAYDFQIRAANEIGDGEWSPTATQSTAERVVRRGNAKAAALEVRAPRATGRRVVIVRTGSGQAVAITIGAAEATGRDVAIVRTGSGQPVVVEVGAAEASGVIPQPAEGQPVALTVTVARATGRNLIASGAGQAVAITVGAGEATGLAMRRGAGQPVVIEVTASRATAEGHAVPVGGIQLEGIPLTLDQRYIVLTDSEEEES